MKKLALLLAVPVLASAAESPCDYQHKVTGSYVKQIDRVLDIDRYVSKETDNINVCRVSMTVQIGGEEFDTTGQFSYGPDMSENTACGHAEQRAKENIIRQISPEILNANTTMDCGVKREKERVVVNNIDPNFIPNPNYPYRRVDPNYQMPQVILQYEQPNPVIIYQHQPTELSPLDVLKLGITILPFVGK
jgi:hypothetical protein